MGALKRLIVVAASCVSVLLTGQEEGTIIWIDQKRLSWDDFKAEPPKNNMVAATTACGISYQFSSTVTGNTAEIDFEVAAYFYPDRSWYRPETANEGILGHEQLHFDITELFAREMRYRLAQTKFTGNVKAEVKAIYSQVNQDLTQFQERYDRETNFSRDSVQQKKWNNMIAEKLISKGF